MTKFLNLAQTLDSNVTDNAPSVKAVKNVVDNLSSEISGVMGDIAALDMDKANRSDLSLKQDILTAGENITISDDGTISASAGVSVVATLTRY